MTSSASKEDTLNYLTEKPNAWELEQTAATILNNNLDQEVEYNSLCENGLAAQSMKKPWVI